MNSTLRARILTALAALLVFAALAPSAFGLSASAAGKPGPGQTPVAGKQVRTDAPTDDSFVEHDYAQPQGVASIVLTRTTSLNANSVYGVGSYTLTSNSTENGIVEKWNGVNWTIAGTYNAPGARWGTYLSGIVANSPSDILVAGFYRPTMTQTIPLALHFDSTTSTFVQLQFSQTLGTDGAFYSVVKVANNDYWFLGSWHLNSENNRHAYHVRYNGASFTEMPETTADAYGQLYDAAVIGANDILAVGEMVGNNYGIYSQHWDGTTWSRADISPPGSGALYQVNAKSSTDAWAVGGAVYNGHTFPYVLRWDGTRWLYVVQDTTSGVNSILRGVESFDNAQNPTDVVVDGDDGVYSWTGTGLWYHLSFPVSYGFKNMNNGWIVGTNGQAAFNTGRYIVSTPTPTATATPSNCGTFGDVPETSPFYTPIHYLACNGVISGYGDGTFRPGNNTTRGQLSKIIVLAEGWATNTTGGPHFSDVPETSPFYGVIETAYNHGIISGYGDGTFKPGNNVTRGQLSKIIVLAEGWATNTTGGPHFSDVPETSPFYGVIEIAYNHGIISGYGDGTFKPGNNATRGQISKIVYLAVTQP